MDTRIGCQTVKNITKPIVAYRVLIEPRTNVSSIKQKIKAAPIKRNKAVLDKAVLVGVILALLIIVGIGAWYHIWITKYFSEVAEVTDNNGKISKPGSPEKLGYKGCANSPQRLAHLLIISLSERIQNC